MATVQRHFSWTPVPAGQIGRVDVHSHLIPAVDDGCQSLDESIECARLLVREGYTHSFCTPHVWPNLPLNTVENIRRMVADLQIALERADVVVISGSLNTADDAVFYATLRHAYEAATEALVFNFLSSTSLAGQPHLYWRSPRDVLRFARSLSDDVRTLDDYLSGDTTVRVGRRHT